jgi:hypothetical protein
MSIHDQIEYWSKLADRPLTKFEQLLIARPYKWDGYWHTWNRVLKPVWGGEPHGMVEVNITPVNGWLTRDQTGTTRRPEAIAEIEALKIRNHLTSSDHNDKFQSSLPEDERRVLVSMIGMEASNYLLFGDIWSIIDWDKYRRQSLLSKGGGIPLALIRNNAQGYESTREFDNRSSHA